MPERNLIWGMRNVIRVMPEERGWNKLLIMACHRSGTKSISHILRLSGLDVRHENNIGEDGTVNGKFVYKGDNLKIFDHVFHQLRYPPHVISSLHATKWWRKLSQHIDIGKEPYPKILKDRTLRNMKAWYNIYLQNEKVSQWTYRIEDVVSPSPNPNFGLKYKELCERLNIQPRDFGLRYYGNYHSRKSYKDRGQMTYTYESWETMAEVDNKLCAAIKEIAAIHGYPTDDKQKL